MDGPHPKQLELLSILMVWCRITFLGIRMGLLDHRFKLNDQRFQFPPWAQAIGDDYQLP